MMLDVCSGCYLLSACEFLLCFFPSSSATLWDGITFRQFFFCARLFLCVFYWLIKISALYVYLWIERSVNDSLLIVLSICLIFFLRKSINLGHFFVRNFVFNVVWWFRSRAYGDFCRHSMVISADSLWLFLPIAYGDFDQQPKQCILGLGTIATFFSSSSNVRSNHIQISVGTWKSRKKCCVRKHRCKNWNQKMNTYKMSMYTLIWCSVEEQHTSYRNSGEQIWWAKPESHTWNRTGSKRGSKRTNEEQNEKKRIKCTRNSATMRWQKQHAANVELRWKLDIEARKIKIPSHRVTKCFKLQTNERTWATNLCCCVFFPFIFGNNEQINSQRRFFIMSPFLVPFFSLSLFLPFSILDVSVCVSLFYSIRLFIPWCFWIAVARRLSSNDALTCLHEKRTLKDVRRTIHKSISTE